jgi:PAS domain S-box-containing protein
MDGCDNRNADAHIEPSSQVKNASESHAGRAARLTRILDMLFDGILVIQEGVIIETNQGLVSMTGYDLSELLGRKIEELEGWQDLGRDLAAVTEECVSFESALPRKGSRPAWATVRAVRASFGGSAVVIAVIAGMTEDEPASTYLLRSAERYRSLFESVPDLIYTKDTDLRFLEVNPAMEKTLGLPNSQIVGRTAEEIYGPEAGERIRSWDLRVLSGETIEEEHAVLVSGERLTFHDVRVPVRNSSGEIVGVCGICRDITDRRRIMAPTSSPASSHPPSTHASKAMMATMELAAQAAATDSIVLLQGESGTGKDHLARWIHSHSRRADSPFLPINCAALPQELAESELFGHESGAFTGARSGKRGLLEMAEGGTLLLNEIGELSLALQSKLLVFLDSRSFLRLGGEKAVHVDARIMAATYRNLEADVAAGKFMEPLYYRLNVFPIELPPLRKRVEDIPILVKEIVEQLAVELNLSDILGLDAVNIESLLGYHWPGNVRELRNVIERGLILRRKGPLRFPLPSSEIGEGSRSYEVTFVPGKSFRRLTREVMEFVCLDAVRRHGGNKKAAARALGISRDSLYRYIKGLRESQEISQPRH